MFTATNLRRGRAAQTDRIRGDLPIANTNHSSFGNLFGYTGTATDTLQVGAISVLAGVENETANMTANLTLDGSLQGALGGISVDAAKSGYGNNPATQLHQTAMNMASADQIKNVFTNPDTGLVSVSTF